MWEEIRPYKCPECGEVKYMTWSESAKYPQIECDSCHSENPVKTREA